MQAHMVHLYGYSASRGETNFSIFLEAVLAIELIQESQSNLKEKNKPSILKFDFSSRTDPTIFTSEAPITLD